jgi:proteasome lid subunit RPN8/RPN11
MGVRASQGDRGTQTLCGVSWRHPNIDDRYVRMVLGDRFDQGIAVTNSGRHHVATVEEDFDEARSDYRGVFGDYHSHPVTSFKVGGGLSRSPR